MDAFADLFLEAMHYEHWLRFYFLEDVEEPEHGPMQSSPERELTVESMDARLALPAEAAARSRAEEPEFAGILDALQGNIISMERSRDVIFHWLGEKTGVIPGSAEFEARMSALAGDAAFRRRLGLTPEEYCRRAQPALQPETPVRPSADSTERFYSRRESLELLKQL